MQRRKMLKAAATVAAPWLIPALSQSRVRRIGVLYPWIDPGTAPAGAAAFWKQHGWIVGDTLNIERRYAAWRVERMPEFADDLLRRFDVELLMAFGPEAAAAAARATRTVPIVFIGAYLPVECGLIDSYARPGRNCARVRASEIVEVNTGDARKRRAFAERQAKAQSELKKLFTSARIDSIQLGTGESYSGALARFFETRERRLRHG